MDLGRAETAYVGIVAAVAALILWGGGVDGYLYLTGQRTISDLLRASPTWFIWPAVIAQLFLLILIVHLYLTGK